MMQNANPLVSTIVVSYNQSRFVSETLESVKAQTYKNTQLIIVDDCSSDGSVATIEHWLKENGIGCAFIRHQKNQGVCKSLNDALAVADGEYISMVAADDVWLSDKISRQVEIMESQPDYVGILYSDAFQMDEHGHALSDMFIAAHRDFSEMPQGKILNTLLDGNFIPGMTTLIRRSCYDLVGLYDENLPWEDWDMWLRLARHYSFVYSPMPSAKYRCHAKSLSHSDRASMLRGAGGVYFKQFGLGDLEQRQKSMLIRRLMDLAFNSYPDFPDITRLALGYVRELGGSDYFPRFGSWRGELLKHIIGWKATRRANVLYHRHVALKWSRIEQYFIRSLF
jgi:glycosyltransferase involved in cell wall biosynthesis